MGDGKAPDELDAHTAARNRYEGIAMSDAPPFAEFPTDRPLSKKDAFGALITEPLERITWSINRGDPWDLRDLHVVRNRCAGLVAAYDRRMEARKNDQ